MSMITNVILLSSRVVHSSVCFPCSVSLSFLLFLSLIGILALSLIHLRDSQLRMWPQLAF